MRTSPSLPTIFLLHISSPMATATATDTTTTMMVEDANTILRSEGGPYLEMLSRQKLPMPLKTRGMRMKSRMRLGMILEE